MNKRSLKIFGEKYKRKLAFALFLVISLGCLGWLYGERHNILQWYVENYSTISAETEDL